MVAATQVEQHRADLAAVTTLAVADLALVFAQLRTAEAVRDGLLEVLPRLVALYGAAAATLGADWFEEVRDAEDVPGRFTAIPAVLPDRARTDALARWGVEPLFSAEPDVAIAESKVGGGLQRIITNADRESVTASSVQDPRARGWARAGSGDGCDFCRLLIGRGAVYTEATAAFESHDRCGCIAVPVFG